MELYLLKSTLCLALFFAFYKMVLENTSIHHFKRFYLLGSLLAAFIIPLITFTTYVEPLSTTPIYGSVSEQGIFSNSEKIINYWPVVLWTIYGLGVLFFSVKFFRNIHILIRKISQNAKNRKNNFTYVLLSEPVIPHTFFNYIFLNKRQFESGEIPLEVMFHEEAHARQRHSLDIIIIEILKIIFWFNPLFYFLKRSIKLNHEFLADQAVLRNGIETSAYQKLLLTFSTPEGHQDILTPSLAHSINYSSMKKRFTIMKTNTSRRAILFRSLLILPLLSMLIFGFSTTETVERQINSGYASTNDTIEDIHIKIDENSKISLNGNPVALSSLKDELNKLNTSLSLEQKEKYLSASIEIEDENFINLAEEVGSILYICNIRSWQVSSLKGRRNSGIKYIRPNNPMAGKSVKEAEILHQQYLKDLEEFKKANANRSVKEDKNNPWSIQVEEHTMSPDSAHYYYEGKLIPIEKAHKLLSENDALKMYVSKTEDGQRIVTISEKPILEKK